MAGAVDDSTININRGTSVISIITDLVRFNCRRVYARETVCVPANYSVNVPVRCHTVTHTHTHTHTSL